LPPCFKVTANFEIVKYFGSLHSHENARLIAWHFPFSLVVLAQLYDYIKIFYLPATLKVKWIHSGRSRGSTNERSSNLEIQSKDYHPKQQPRKPCCGQLVRFQLNLIRG